MRLTLLRTATTVAHTVSPLAGTGRQDFEDYAANLLDSVVTNSPELVANASLSPSLQPLRSPTIMEAVPALRPERRSRSNGALGAGASPDDDEDVGCKAAVEIVSRNSQKGESRSRCFECVLDREMLIRGHIVNSLV